VADGACRCTTCRFLVTDGEEQFARVGPLFLGRPIATGEIERVDL
jgi:hypothetical protein